MKKLSVIISFFFFLHTTNAQILDTTKINVRQNLNYQFKGLRVDTAVMVGKENMNETDLVNIKKNGNIKTPITVNIGGGNIGGINDGQVFTAGTSIETILNAMLTKVIHPNYNMPTVVISTNVPFGTYEIGTALGTISLSSTFTQNDAGSLTATTYYNNGTALGGNSFLINSLTSTVTVSVNKAYNTGACKLNNLNNTDCYGQITAGNISAANNYYIGYSYYIGTCAAPTPTDAEIKAAVVAFGSSKNKSNVNVSVSGNQYIFYAYPSTQGNLTRVYNTLGDFTLDTNGWLLTTRAGFNNAVGYNVPLNVYVLQSPQSGNVNGLNFQ
ncbi:MAG: hypothetical protein JST29_05480 [Bacteroidetes bacterium]|nr:hypothetical protein [Bacteroidota bacterium]